ncbi:MAG: DUF4440 domain-containing protein [Alphaproteobacteria bacterium]|nr:DUF4440 domain-containing protein [Alphaproteobacteria bacterium]
MRFAHIAKIWTVVLGLAIAIAAAPVSAGDARQELDALNADWVKLFKDKDAAAIAAFYADDGLFLPPNAAPIQGQGPIGEMWTTLTQMPGVAFSIATERLEIAASGDLAYDYGVYDLAYDGDNGRVTDRGKYVVVWKRVDGGWRVAADIFNSNGAP